MKKKAFLFFFLFECHKLDSIHIAAAATAAKDACIYLLFDHFSTFTLKTVNACAF